MHVPEFSALVYVFMHGRLTVACGKGTFDAGLVEGKVNDYRLYRNYRAAKLLCQAATKFCPRHVC